MKIFIITMDDPLQTNRFMKYVIDNCNHDFVGLAVAKGGRLKIGKKKSKITYLFSLLLIMGFTHFFINVFKTIFFKIQKSLSKYHIFKNPSIIAYAAEKNIRTFNISNPNNKKFIKELSDLEPDIIINQSQHIIKKGILDIPSIGVLNRHNALLPKNRGRLTPFWVLFRREKESGVSIHFLEKGIDSGDIVVQKRFRVNKNYTFNSLVKKNYEIAPKAMVEAIKKINDGNYKLIPNDSKNASYNSIPTFYDALSYRLIRISRFWR